MDKSPNTGKSTTGGDKPQNTPTVDAESSAVTPPPPSPPYAVAAAAADQDVPTENTTPPVNVGTRHVTPTRPVHAGGSSVETSQRIRKRNRSDHEVMGGSSSSTRSRLEGPDNMGTPPTCCVCGKQFASWKALFGHMRTHPERQWRGVFPPPTFNQDESPENIMEPQPQPLKDDLSSTLLNIAQGVLDKIGGAGPSSGQNKRLPFDLDLNVAWEPPMESPPPPPVSPPPPPQSPPPPPPRSPTPPPPRRDGDGHPILDLNKSPPQE